MLVVFLLWSPTPELSAPGAGLTPTILGIVTLAPGHSNQACVQHYSNPARQGFCCDNAHAFHQLSCSSIGERRVLRDNKYLAWLGSSSAAGVLDSNGRGQGDNTWYWEGSPAPGADNSGVELHRHACYFCLKCSVIRRY